MRGTPPDQVDRHAEGDHQEGEDAQLEEEVREHATILGKRLGFGGDDYDPSHHRNDPDKEEGLRGNLATVDDDPKRVEELGDDEQEEDPVENPQTQSRSRLVHPQPVDKAIAVVVQDEKAGHQKQPADDDVEAGLGDGDLLPGPLDVQRKPPPPAPAAAAAGSGE